MAAKNGCHGDEGGRGRWQPKMAAAGTRGDEGAGGCCDDIATYGTGQDGTGRNGMGWNRTGRDGLLEADGGAVLGALVVGLDELVLAELLDGGEGGVLTGEDEVDGALACDVLDLTA